MKIFYNTYRDIFAFASKAIQRHSPRHVSFALGGCAARGQQCEIRIPMAF